MTPVSYFILHLITLPDIQGNAHAIHRLVFSYKEDCIEMAQRLGQLKDPWVGKNNCIEVDNYDIEVRIPLRKPKEML